MTSQWLGRYWGTVQTSLPLTTKEMVLCILQRVAASLTYVYMPLRLKSTPDFKVIQSYISEGCVYLIVRFYYSVHR